MRALAVIAVIAAFVAAGCSSKSTPSSITSSSPEASASEAPAASPPVSLAGTVNNHGTKDIAMATTLQLEQDNYYFDPTFVKAEPGAHLTVTLKNEGKVPHTFTIDSLHVDQTVLPDQTKTVTFTLPSSGTVPFYCKFHKGMGMQGAFFFTAGGGAAPASTQAPASSGSSSGY